MNPAALAILFSVDADHFQEFEDGFEWSAGNFTQEFDLSDEIELGKVYWWMLCVLRARFNHLCTVIGGQRTIEEMYLYSVLHDEAIQLATGQAVVDFYVEWCRQEHSFKGVACA